MGGSPRVPDVPAYEPPADDAAAKKTAALEAKRRRASNILTDSATEEAPSTKLKTVLGG